MHNVQWCGYRAPGDSAGLGIFELFAYLRTQVPTDARQIVYRGHPLQQEPLFYASQLDANIAVALRPGTSGGTLSSALEQQVRRLVELELALAPNEASAPATLRAERDRLLALVKSGQ